MAQQPGVLELRVHGVSGTPPHQMLGCQQSKVGQVAGDGLTGLYRVREGQPPGATVPTYAAVEAYSWGSLTSAASGFFGWLRRVGWLLLLPFALTNVAYWSRSGLVAASGWPTRTATASAIVVRLSGLLLTVTLVVTACVVGIDLVAWQCFRGGNKACPVLPSWLDIAASDPWDEAPRRLALGSVVPLAGLLLLWLLSRQSLIRYEEVSEPGTTAGQPVPLLRRDDMWRGKDRTVRLQRLHLSVGLSVVVWYVAFPLAWPECSALRIACFEPVRNPIGWVGVVSLVLILGGFAVTALTYKDGVEFAGGPGSLLRRAPGILLVLSLELVVVHLVVLMIPYAPGVDENGDLRGHNVWLVLSFGALALSVAWLFAASRCPVGATFASFGFLALLLLCSPWFGSPEAVRWSAAGVLVLGLFLALVRHRASGTPSQAWGGAAPSVLFGASVWVALLFTTAGTVLVADWLNGGDRSVADLEANYRPEGPLEPLPAQRAEDRESTEGDVLKIRAVGDLTIEDAVVVVGPDDESVTVTSGRIRAESALLESEPAGATPAVATGMPSTGLSDATIAISEDSVGVRNSVVCRGRATEPPGQPPEPCVPGSSSSLQSGSLDAGGNELVVNSRGGTPVGLEVEQPPQALMVVPQFLVWAAMALPAWLLVVASVAAACYLKLRSRIRLAIDQLILQDGVAARDRQAAQRARTTAAFTHRAERLMGFLGLLTVVTFLAILLGSSTGRPPWELDERLGPLARIGLWTAVGLSALVVVGAAQMRRSESTRRAVGVVWDLTTFWPRVAHPLGPPCYAERVVPEVRHRVDWASEGCRRARVILSGHSQGSVIAVAVAARLSRRRLTRLRLITYGSQLRTWYGRVFPDVLGPHALGHAPMNAAARFNSAAPDAPDPGSPAAAPTFPAPMGPTAIAKWLAVTSSRPRWVNLFRRTDPLGFRVFTDQQSRVDFYVPEVPPPPRGDPGPYVQTHSGYQFSDEYASLVEVWFDNGVPDGLRSKVSEVPFLTE
jgi:hypothetical protein